MATGLDHTGVALPDRRRGARRQVRILVGAETIMAARGGNDVEAFEQTMRSTLDGWA